MVVKNHLDNDGLQLAIVQHFVQEFGLISTPQVSQADQTQTRTTRKYDQINGR